MGLCLVRCRYYHSLRLGDFFCAPHRIGSVGAISRHRQRGGDMQLIDEIEISYFRSYYKFRLRNLRDLNIIFGKNDSGKSNLVRALNLFFSGSPDHNQEFDFSVDFSDKRSVESENSEGIRKFLYVKITFNTPKNYQKSLGKSFYVKRQWTVSRGSEYHEEISNNIPNNRRHIVTRFLNKIKFIYIPAIKDIRVFEMLLAGIYDTIGSSDNFTGAIDDFSSKLQSMTQEMFARLPKEISGGTKIGAPTQLSQLFKTLDFETFADGDSLPKSLTRQRGDGIKVRHIPELLNFISENDQFDFHIWGFEEPENSLDFSASQSEAKRLLSLAIGERVQVFMTTHSPSFYMLEDRHASKFYVSKEKDGSSVVLQGRELKEFDPQKAIGDGFYLPAVADALKNVVEKEQRIKDAESKVDLLRREIDGITRPLILTEGRTDALILQEAWKKLYETDATFVIRSCELGGENAGSGNGGASSLAVRLKGIANDHPHAVIGLFDYDDEGLKAFQLDRNFVDMNLLETGIKRGMHGRSYAMLLPAPEYRKECENHKNLPIEYMFSDSCLSKIVDGKRIELKRKKASTVVGGNKFEFELPDETHLKDIKSGKSEFAKTIVPTFEREDFLPFIKLFNLVNAIIEYDGNLK